MNLERLKEEHEHLANYYAGLVTCMTFEAFGLSLDEAKTRTWYHTAFAEGVQECIRSIEAAGMTREVES